MIFTGTNFYTPEDAFVKYLKTKLVYPIIEIRFLIVMFIGFFCVWKVSILLMTHSFVIVFKFGRFMCNITGVLIQHNAFKVFCPSEDVLKFQSACPTVVLILAVNICYVRQSWRSFIDKWCFWCITICKQISVEIARKQDSHQSLT